MSTVHTDIGYCTHERIYVRDHDLGRDLIGKLDFIDMFLLVVLGRTSRPGEKDMINAILVTVMDHGFTPSSLAARLTYLGAPEAPQAAVAAGLLGAGSVFLGAMENAAGMLQEIVRDIPEDAADAQVEAAVAKHYASRKAARVAFYGLGHNIHSDGDPRIPALREVSRRCGFYGRHWNVLEMLHEQSAKQAGKKALPINAAGAVGAMVADMGLPLGMARGISLVGRCAGLIGHIVEERQAPIGMALWDLVLKQDARNAIDP